MLDLIFPNDECSEISLMELIVDFFIILEVERMLRSYIALMIDHNIIISIINPI